MTTTTIAATTTATTTDTTTTRGVLDWAPWMELGTSTCKQPSDEFERKELEAWENIKVENTMQGNGTTLFEMGAVQYIVIYIISTSNALIC